MENLICIRRSLMSFGLVVVSALFTGSVCAADAGPSLAAGQPAPAFESKAVAGNVIKFPEAYKGKVVLLDFWATWCAPCRAELPNVVAAYQQFHSQGFEVLGISLDRPKTGPQLIQFTQENKMPWPQIYDGKYWKADLAVKYGIRSIPRAILVDGDTGIILAEGKDARGHHLAAAIEKALAEKKKK